MSEFFFAGMPIPESEREGFDHFHKWMNESAGEVFHAMICQHGHSKEAVHDCIKYCVVKLQECQLPYVNQFEREHQATLSLAMMMLVSLIETVMSNPLYDDHLVVDQICEAFKNTLRNSHSLKLGGPDG